jgi:hypothetical protein
MSSSCNDTGLQKLCKHLEVVIHSKWGLVIYRCTYADHEAWDRFMNIIKEQLHGGLEAEHWLDLESKPVRTVNENPDAFDGNTIEEVQEHFKV